MKSLRKIQYLRKYAVFPRISTRGCCLKCSFVGMKSLWNDGITGRFMRRWKPEDSTDITVASDTFEADLQTTQSHRWGANEKMFRSSLKVRRLVTNQFDEKIRFSLEQLLQHLQVDSNDATQTHRLQVWLHFKENYLARFFATSRVSSFEQNYKPLFHYLG